MHIHEKMQVICVYIVYIYIYMKLYEYVSNYVYNIYIYIYICYNMIKPMVQSSDTRESNNSA